MINMIPVTVNCPNCGIVFQCAQYRWNRHIKHGIPKRIFCGKICANVFHSKEMSEHNISTRPDVAKKISAALKGRVISVAHRTDISLTRRRLYSEGKLIPFSPNHSREVREHIRMSMRKWWEGARQNPEFMARHKEQKSRLMLAMNFSDNPSKWPEVKAKNSARLMKLYAEHPELHPNSILAHSRKTLRVQTELPVCNLLTDMGYRLNVDFFHNYYVNTPSGHYWLDFAFPQLKLDIECDGSYWHKDTEKDKIRDIALSEMGWTVTRMSERITMNRVKLADALTRIIPSRSEILVATSH